MGQGLLHQSLGAERVIRANTRPSFPDAEQRILTLKPVPDLMYIGALLEMDERIGQF
jgi:hypothetical protein